MLRTADELIAALRSRKDVLGLSNAVVDEISGYTEGWWDKVAGPSRMKSPSLATIMALCGALGLAVQLVEDPATQVQRRWQRRSEPQAHRNNGRLSRLRRAKAEAVAELARKAARARWARMSPEQRKGVAAALVAARMAKRRARTSEAA